jgi:hypothetical protein
MNITSPSALDPDQFTVNATHETVLIVGADAARRNQVGRAVEAGGWLPLQVSTVAESVDLLVSAPPSLVVLTVDDSGRPLFGVLDKLRSDPDGERVPCRAAQCGIR